MPSHVDFLFWSIFGRFLLPTSTRQSQLNTSGLAFSWFSAFKVDIVFWSHFGANLPPFWHPKSTQIHPKIDSKRHQKNDRFLHRFFPDFGSILGPKLGPCWEGKSSQDRTRQVKTGQDRTRQGKTRQRQDKTQFCVGVAPAGGSGVYPFPNWGNTGPKTLPGWRGWGFLLRLFWHLGAFHFSIVFSMPFWIDFCSIFHPNLVPKID